MKNIGLFGGSFDPVHKGHIELAKTVLKNSDLDEIWFIPTFDQPFKDNHVESFENRKKLLEVALKPYRNIKICDIEESLPTPSYTYNTVSKLQKNYPNYNLFWIIGDDQIPNLDKWYKIEELLKLIQFIVVNRNEIEVDSKFVHIDFKHPASSSAVRAGNFNYLPKVVVEKIYEEEMYFQHILRQNLSEERAAHTLRCVEVAKEIGAYYNVNQTDLFKAVVLHDITKELDPDKELVIMNNNYPHHLKENKKLYHQYTAAFVARRDFCVFDKKILRAIANHSTGDDISLLGMLTYVADKLERGRPYEVEHYIEKCKSNLYKEFKIVKEDAEKARKLKEF